MTRVSRLFVSAWNDADRVLHWDRNRQRLAIGDARTITTQFVDGLEPGAVTAFPVLDAAQLLLPRNKLESELWTMELGEGLVLA